jgi:hypothetical protein
VQGGLTHNSGRGVGPAPLYSITPAPAPILRRGGLAMSNKSNRTHIITLKFLYIIFSALICACIPPAHETISFKRIEQLETKLQDDISNLQQELSVWEKRELEFLKGLNLNEAAAYSNYKESINQLSQDSDNAKAIVAQKYLRAAFDSSPSRSHLFSTAVKLVHKLSRLSSDIKLIKFMLNDTMQHKEWYLRNYQR